MQDDFSDFPSASPEVTEGFRKLIGEHNRIIDKALAEQPFLMIGLGGKETMAVEVLKHTPASMIVASGPISTMAESLHEPMKDRFIHMQLEVSYEPLDFIDYGDFHYVSEADERKLPEWQKRRNKSAEAKQALINKLKAKRNAR